MVSMKAKRVFETVLYARDLDAAEEFYRNVVGLEVQSRFGVGMAFRCGNSVVLVFDPDQTRGSERAPSGKTSSWWRTTIAPGDRCPPARDGGPWTHRVRSGGGGARHNGDRASRPVSSKSTRKSAGGRTVAGQSMCAILQGIAWSSPCQLSGVVDGTSVNLRRLTNPLFVRQQPG